MKRLLVPFVLPGASFPDRPQPLTAGAHAGRRADRRRGRAGGDGARPGTPGKTIRFARGVANRTTSAPLQSRQPFRIGSITKTFVATVVLQSRAREL
jgi:CubicO group peptidase (beta-lactamase class C family)